MSSSEQPFSGFEHREELINRMVPVLKQIAKDNGSPYEKEVLISVIANAQQFVETGNFPEKPAADYCAYSKENYLYGNGERREINRVTFAYGVNETAKDGSQRIIMSSDGIFQETYNEERDEWLHVSKLDSKFSQKLQ